MMTSQYYNFTASFALTFAYFAFLIAKSGKNATFFLVNQHFLHVFVHNKYFLLKQN